MLFSSATFLFAFLPAVTLLYYIIPARFRTARNMLLTLVSILFYAWGEPRFVVVMLAMIAVNWALALLAEAQGDKYRRMVLVTAVAVNISLLFVFKYLTFVLENTNRFLGLSIQVPSITLPIGISFFTFQAMSYVIDVCRGDGKAQRNILNVMLYIAFFPQLIAGPIVRYSDFADQINCRTESFDGWSGGCCRFALGLGKKVILSNNLAYVADAAFSSIGNMSVLLAWLGRLHTHYRFILIFPVILIWPLAWGGCSGFASGRISTTRILAALYQNSGGAGISLWAVGSAITCTSLWVAAV